MNYFWQAMFEPFCGKKGVAVPGLVASGCGVQQGIEGL